MRVLQNLVARLRGEGAEEEGAHIGGNVRRLHVVIVHTDHLRRDRSECGSRLLIKVSGTVTLDVSYDVGSRVDLLETRARCLEGRPSILRRTKRRALRSLTPL